MNAFHVLGGLLALWALLVSFLGIRSKDFPGDRNGERIVSAISILLVAAAIGAGIVTSALEDEEEHEGEHETGEAAVLVVRG